MYSPPHHLPYGYHHKTGRSGIIASITNYFKPFRYTLNDRYLLSEYLKVSFSSLAFFVMLFLFLQMVVEVPKYLVAEDKPNATIGNLMTFYLLQVPYIIVLLSPIAFPFAITFVLGNFYKNHEVVAVIGAGVNLYRYTFMILVVTFIYCILLYLGSDSVVAPMYNESEVLRNLIDNKQENVTKNVNRDVIPGEANRVYIIDRFDSINKIFHGVNIVKERYSATLPEWEESMKPDAKPHTASESVMSDEALLELLKAEEYEPGFTQRERMDDLKRLEMENKINPPAPGTEGNKPPVDAAKPPESDQPPTAKDAASKEKDIPEKEKDAKKNEKGKPETTTSESNGKEEPKDPTKDASSTISSNPILNQDDHPIYQNKPIDTEKEVNNKTTPTTLDTTTKPVAHADQDIYTLLEEKKDRWSHEKSSNTESSDSVSVTKDSNVATSPTDAEANTKESETGQGEPKKSVAEPTKAAAISKHQPAYYYEEPVEKPYYPTLESFRSAEPSPTVPVTTSSGAVPVPLPVPTTESISNGVLTVETSTIAENNTVLTTEIHPDANIDGADAHEPNSSTGESSETNSAPGAGESNPPNLTTSDTGSVDGFATPATVSESKAAAKKPIKPTNYNYLEYPFEYQESVDSVSTAAALVSKTLDAASTDKNSSNGSYSESSKDPVAIDAFNVLTSSKSPRANAEREGLANKTDALNTSSGGADAGNTNQPLGNKKNRPGLLIENDEDIWKYVSTEKDPDSELLQSRMEKTDSRRIEFEGAPSDEYFHKDQVMFIDPEGSDNSRPVFDIGSSYQNEQGHVQPEILILPESSDSAAGKMDESLFKIDETMFEKPTQSFYEWRIAAKELKWHDKKQRWVAYEGTKWIWGPSGKIIKQISLDNVVLNELEEDPSYFDQFSKNTRTIYRLTWDDCKQIINKLKRTRKPYKDLESEMFGTKVAWQFATFFVVFLGLGLLGMGSFHGRKAVLIRSFIMSIAFFFLYFVFHQLGTSLGKTQNTIPSYVMVHLGNLLFFVTGLFLAWKAKT